MEPDKCRLKRLSDWVTPIPRQPTVTSEPGLSHTGVVTPSAKYCVATGRLGNRSSIATFRITVSLDANLVSTQHKKITPDALTRIGRRVSDRLWGTNGRQNEHCLKVCCIGRVVCVAHVHRPTNRPHNGAGGNGLGIIAPTPVSFVSQWRPGFSCAYRTDCSQYIFVFQGSSLRTTGSTVSLVMHYPALHQNLMMLWLSSTRSLGSQFLRNDEFESSMCSIRLQGPMELICKYT
ncbi:hypothetical protein EV401DRAFT_1349575 [Pisolithus croceorrhizus]|nr:hypothetical protein EV401DRAFT_1349575 [Pisolithus croceorrhizus]